MNPFARFMSSSKRRGARSEVLPEENEGPPDSTRPQGLCPRCGKPSSFEVIGSLPVTIDHETYFQDSEGKIGHDALDQVSVLVCRNCHHGVVVVEEQFIGDHPRSQSRGGGGVISWRGFNWWPVPESQLSGHVPASIASAFAEAGSAFYARCYRASAVMARRALEAVCVDKGRSAGSLADRIKAMAAAGVLVPTLADWATEVRLVGNVGAHFDPLEDVTPADAQALLKFTRELLRYLYELPAELAARRVPQP